MKRITAQSRALQWLFQYGALIVCLAQFGCGSAAPGTEVATGGGDAEKSAGGAVAALFGSSASANVARLKLVRTVKETGVEGEEGRGSTCDEALRGDVSTDHQIRMTAAGAVGAYGSDQAGVVVAAADFCALPDSPTTLNTAAGFDGEGLVATFALEGDVNARCDSDLTIVMQSGSAGIWRNTSDYFPQVWGTFNFLVNGEPLTLNCTLYLGEDETILFADCSNESGTVVNQDSSASCQIVTE